MEERRLRNEVGVDASRFSPYNFGSQGPLWWGMWGLILIEAAVFASLIASYFYLGSSYPEWPPAGVKEPELLLPTIASAVIFASSLPMHWADKAIKEGNGRSLKINLTVSIGLALVFLALKYFEYSDAPYRWDSHVYGSIVWAIIMFHSTHVTALVLKTAVVDALAWRGYFNRRRRLGVTANGLYWHFVVAVWLPLYLVLYWSPRFMK
jgi:heme/copper-type cytochrome/quinol oxidase subunit 3